jgi:hypothetical protein
LPTSANSREDFVVLAHEQERRGEQVVDGHVQFSGRPGHGTLRIAKLASIIDQHTRERLTSLLERSATADAPIDKPDRPTPTRGYPAVPRCDNDPEPACEAMADRAGEHVVMSFSPPGEPWRNGYVESPDRHYPHPARQAPDRASGHTVPAGRPRGPSRALVGRRFMSQARSGEFLLASQYARTRLSLSQPSARESSD